MRTLLLMRRYETIALPSSLRNASALLANLNSVATFPTSSGLGTVQLLISRVTVHLTALSILRIAKCGARDPLGVAVQQERLTVEMAPAERRSAA